ncbi:DUF1593 domain-containing protein [Tessaracoccus sp. MC1679]|nr:DUF1593 domain-containing protein [Tessaracoccus sp. MC1679]
MQHIPAPQSVPPASRPRTIITTDSEADDINSFLRLLYYANELDIVGLIYNSSVHHWQGDGVHTLREAREAGMLTSFMGETAGSEARSDDALTWRWEPMGWMERIILEDYARIYPNLLQHDRSYPSPADLWATVAVGNVTFESDFSADTEGSELIEAALLDDDPRPLYLQVWGGRTPSPAPCSASRRGTSDPTSGPTSRRRSPARRSSSASASRTPPMPTTSPRRGPRSRCSTSTAPSAGSPRSPAGSPPPRSCPTTRPRSGRPTSSTATARCSPTTG